MSRTIRGSKPKGDYDYWTARPGNRHGEGCGSYAKKLTHRMERHQGKKAAVSDE